MATTFDSHKANERRGDTSNHVKVTCQHVMFTADEKCQPLRNLLYLDMDAQMLMNACKRVVRSNLNSIC